MNIGKLKVNLAEIKNKIWFVPSILTLTAAVLSAVLLWVDRTYATQINQTLPWLFTGTPDAARGLLSTIASSVITVISIAFSMTIVALQQASTQYSPRILRTFTKSRGNQIVLGMYIATFVYALLTLRAIRTGEGADVSSYVPSLSISFALLLTLTCLGLLIYFIYHISQTLQVSEIIIRVHKDLIQQIDKMFPEQIGKKADDSETAEELMRKQKKQEKQFVLASREYGFIQKLDKNSLADLNPRGIRYVYITRQVGEFVSEGDPLVIVSKKIEEKKISDKILNAVIINSSRSEEQDPLFSVRQLVDIAVKALSPGINDPTTAEYCIYYLSDAIKRLARRKFPENKKTFQGQKMTYYFNQPGWEDFVRKSFSQIRREASESPHVLRTLAEELERIKKHITHKERVKAINLQLKETNKDLKKILQ